MRKPLILRLSIITLCFTASFHAALAENVFNTPPTEVNTTSDFYGNPETIQSPAYYQQAISNKNKQAYQAMLKATSNKNANAKLKALQEKMLNDHNKLGKQAPTSKPTPVYRPAPRPKPTVIYTTPISQKTTNSNGSATNFKTDGNSNTSSSSSSSSDELGIQY